MIRLTKKNMMTTIMCVVLAFAAVSCAESEVTYDKALEISADRKSVV